MKSFCPPRSQHVPSGIFSSTYRAEMISATAVLQQPLARSCVALSHGNPACPALARPSEQLRDLGSGSSYRRCFASSWRSPRTAQGLGQMPGWPRAAPAPRSGAKARPACATQQRLPSGPTQGSRDDAEPLPAARPQRPPCGSQARVRSLPSQASAASCPTFVLSRCRHLADESLVPTSQPGAVPHPRRCTAAPAPGGEQGWGHRAGAAAPAAPDGRRGSSVCLPQPSVCQTQCQA